MSKPSQNKALRTLVRRDRRPMSQLPVGSPTDDRFRSSLNCGHRTSGPPLPKGAMALNRCAIARCAGSPTASAATGGKIVRGCAACLRTWWSRIERSAIPAQDAGGCICIVKNLNDGHRAIGEAVIMLTRSLKQFRLDNIEVCCGLQKLVRAMMLQGCRKADRAEVVERDRFATPNSLKSHGERNLLSHLAILVPKRQSCACLRGQYTPFERLNLHSARGTVGAPHPAISRLGAFRTPAAAACG